MDSRDEGFVADSDKELDYPNDDRPPSLFIRPLFVCLTMAPPMETADSRNNFEDLSGVNSAAYENPYDALIEACEDNPVKIPLSKCFVSVISLNHFDCL